MSLGGIANENAWSDDGGCDGDRTRRSPSATLPTEEEGSRVLDAARSGTERVAFDVVEQCSADPKGRGYVSYGQEGGCLKENRKR